MKHILVDIDDTLAQTQRTMLDYLKAQRGKVLKFSDMTRDFREHNGGDKDYNELVKEFLHDETLVREILPYSFALPSLKKLHKAGNTIHIVSSRRENLHKVTEEWLAKHDFIDYVHHIHERSSDEHGFEFKVRVAKAHNMTVAFEDTFDVALALAESGVKVYLISKPWNRNEAMHPNMIRAKDFGTATDRFLKSRP